MKKSTRIIVAIVATGIGAALFFVLGRFVAIPSPVPNTSISIQYGLLAFMATLFGPLSGALIGFVGHILIDLTYGTPWMSWIISSAVFGLIMGFVGMLFDLKKDKFGLKNILIFNGFQAGAHVISWIVIAPVLDILMYKEPANKVFTQGAVAALANIVTTAIVGTLLCLLYSAAQPKEGSLKKDE